MGRAAGGKTVGDNDHGGRWCRPQSRKQAAVTGFTHWTRFILSIHFFTFHPLSFTQGGWGRRGLAQQSWAEGGPDEAALHHTEGDKRPASLTPPHHSESSIEQNVFVVWEEAGGN